MIQKHAVENILWTKEERHQQVCVAALRHPQVLEIKVLFVEHLSGQTSQSASKQKVKSDQLSFSCFFRETTESTDPNRARQSRKALSALPFSLMGCTASRHWSHDLRELIKGAACPRRALKVTRIFNEKWNRWWVSAAGSLVWREST